MGSAFRSHHQQLSGFHSKLELNFRVELELNSSKSQDDTSPWIQFKSKAEVDSRLPSKLDKAQPVRRINQKLRLLFSTEKARLQWNWSIRRVDSVDNGRDGSRTKTYLTRPKQERVDMFCTLSHKKHVNGHKRTTGLLWEWQSTFVLSTLSPNNIWT